MGGRVPGPGVSGGTEPVTAEQMWAEFASGRGLDDTPYEAWAYGGDADALARLLRNMQCRVNLIRFHAIPDSELKTATEPVMTAFRDRLNSHGITATIRASRGEDIMAACGMLAGKNRQEGAS